MMNREMVLQTLKCARQLYPQVLDEQFPHVLERVVTLWDSPEARSYLADLLNPSCSGGRFNRVGFPDEAWRELLQLQLLRSRREQ
jgi:uncharacterized protein